MARSDDSSSNERSDRRQLDALLRLLQGTRSPFASVAQCAAQATGMEWGRLVQLDPAGRLWNRAAQPADGELHPDRLDGPRALADQFEGVVLQRGRSLSISNAATHRRWRQHPAHARSGTLSFVGVPIRAGGQPWGVLAVHAERARPVTSKPAHFLGRLAEAFGALLEAAYELTPLEQAQAKAVLILDEFGHARSQEGITLPDSGPGTLSSEISRLTGCHPEWLESAWARIGQGPATVESWNGSTGGGMTLYRRTLGTIGLAVSGEDFAAAEPSASAPHPVSELGENGSPGRVWLIQRPSCARETTVEMLEHLGNEVRVLEPEKAATITPHQRDVVLVDVGDWSQLLQQLTPKWSPARQQLLIACDLERPTREAGLASLRKPFRLQDLARGLAELQAGR